MTNNGEGRGRGGLKALCEDIIFVIYSCALAFKREMHHTSRVWLDCTLRSNSLIKKKKKVQDLI